MSTPEDIENHSQSDPKSLSSLLSGPRSLHCSLFIVSGSIWISFWRPWGLENTTNSLRGSSFSSISKFSLRSPLRKDKIIPKTNPNSISCRFRCVRIRFRIRCICIRCIRIRICLRFRCVRIRMCRRLRCVRICFRCVRILALS